MSAVPKHNFKAEDIVKEGRTTQSNIEEIKQWLSFKPNFPEMSEEQICLFLIACNNDLEQVKITIENFFKQKSSSPELFMSRDIDTKENKFTHEVATMAVFPKRTKENYIIGLGCLKDTTYYNFCIEPQIKNAFTLISAYLYDNPPDGLIFIIDIKGVGIMHLTRLKLGPLKKFFAYLQEALPTQLRKVHILNATYIFEKILAISKPFMKKELYDLIITHPPETNMQDFFENHIPASCMPCTFGGELKSLEEMSEDTKEFIRSLKDFLEAEERQIQLYKKEK
ncbi:unnamed protein product [Psylliodes chrysocephalus]|uniref:CRAL-TRIO domain-containing protein n=1 Tax=Psylliodes chrysocephalus TaxID=3402493 RepID=A0A9P0D7E9_9CUCU|nr:unnamed protein product [Psylliodes chrysocephala]